MSEKFVIRMGNVEDTEDIMLLIREFAANMDKTAYLKLTEKDLRELVFQQGHAKVLVATVDGYIVGFAMYYTIFSSFAGKPAIYLEDIYVTPIFRGKGYGRELMKVLLEISDKKGYLKVEWKCLKWNQKAIDFYHRIGAELEEDNFTFTITSKSAMVYG